ncbi:MAG TPA: hypothetical protein VE890_16755, partial [Thermoguttaceae bacterium]|nr:hypothetical protein [Thermoguttaceae bacterium]
MRMLPRWGAFRRVLLVGLCLALGLVTVNMSLAAGLDSAGNTDGVLTWQIGTLDAGESARQVVLFAFDDSHEALVERLDAARKEFPVLSDVQSAETERPASDVVWVKNDTTELGLAGPGHFFWEGLRQGLKSAEGGQLSRFGYFVHYDDGAPQRFGTPIHNKPTENLTIVEPLRAISATEAVVTVAAVDEKLRVRVRAVMGEGPVAGVEFVLTNTAEKPLTDVRLSAYANLEAAHSHENDYSMLDARTGGLLTVDSSSGACVVMAGLDLPASGYSGVWPSAEQLQTASGVDADAWEKFVAIPATVKQQLARALQPGVPHATAGQVEPTEPETRDLTAEEARNVLHRDWLFQADHRPTLARALQEIEWARQLAARLAKTLKTEDLVAETKALDSLQRTIEEQGRAGEPSAKDAQEVYFAVREVKRRIMLKNPAVNFSKVLLVDNPYPQGAEWPHQARHRNGMMAVPGGRLLVLDGLHPGGHVRKLAPEKPGSFWRPDLSFDARRVAFCFKAHDEKS